MNAAVSLMDGLGLDGDRCIRVIPRQEFPTEGLTMLKVQQDPPLRMPTKDWPGR